MDWAVFWATFFTNAYGHPGRKSPRWIILLSQFRLLGKKRLSIVQCDQRKFRHLEKVFQGYFNKDFLLSKIFLVKS
jgi:hypothetical protein